MDYKKISAPGSTITRDVKKYENETGNIYKTIAILSKRANQVSIELKEELNSKLEEFASFSDNLEEVFENREQIEISRYFERLPKPSLIATQEFEESKIYWRDPDDEKHHISGKQR